MGIGTLRRYHDDSRVVGETPLPEGAVDASQEEAAAVAGAEDELENDRKLNEAAATLGHAHAKVITNPDDAEAREELVRAQEAYTEAFAAQAEIETGKTVSADDQPDTPQTTEVRGDPAGEESKGDMEPTVTVKDADDTRSQGDATPQEGQGPAEAGETPAGGSEDPSGENGAESGAQGAAEASTAHGDVERPSSTGSTDAWIAYAKADPKGEPFDLTKRAGLRDDLVAHYSQG